jgi:predicted Zn finger-like uncharacterized protein
MIITCPRCATRYLLETGVVRPPGRQVRCARCQRFEIPAPLTHPPSPSSSSSRSIPGFGVSDRVRTRSRSMIGIVALVALVAGFPLLFFLLPQEIVRLWPESASLYDWLDMPVNARGFKIIATHSQEMNGSVPTIAIKGQIINETDRELEVPKIRLSVRDKDKRELYHWTVLADQQKLGPREEGSFTARLESPPPDAADLEVRFAKAGE